MIKKKLVRRTSLVRWETGSGCIEFENMINHSTEKKIGNIDNLIYYFVFPLHLYDISVIIGSFFIRLRKLLEKSINNLFKVPIRTNSLSKKVLYSKTHILDCFSKFSHRKTKINIIKPLDPHRIYNECLLVSFLSMEIQFILCNIKLFVDIYRNSVQAMY